MRSLLSGSRLIPGTALVLAFSIGSFPALAQDETSPAESAPAELAEPAPADATSAEAASAETAPADSAAAAEPAPEAAPEAAATESGEPVTAEAPDAADPSADPAAAPTPEVATTIPVEPVAEATNPGLAVEEGTQKLDTVEVTGSRIRRSNFETAQPVLVVKREDIERTGLVSIGDLLQNLPQAGAALSRSFNNGGNGSTEIDLRNLGSARVLVLVNGRRWVTGVSQFNTGAVDLNTIPISAIDSIEILKDGASAVYGSDAIAGVVNIKTKRDFQGSQVRGHIGATDRGDGVEQLVNFSTGSISSNTSVFLDVSYVNQKPLFSRDREQTSVPTIGTGLTRGSGNSPFGKALFVTNETNANAINAAAGTPAGPAAACRELTTGVANGAILDPLDNPDPAVGDPFPPLYGPGGIISDDPDDAPEAPGVPFPAGVILCDITLDRVAFANGDREFTRYDRNLHAYNYTDQNYLITPSERTGIFGQLSHQLTDSIRFSSEVLYNIRRSSQQLASTPVPIVGDALGSFDSFRPFSSVYVDRTNPYNPTNPDSPYYIPGTAAQDIARSAGSQGLPVLGYGAANIRFNELGPRLFEQDVATMRVGGGFDGSFDLIGRNFGWDAGFAFGESKLTETDAGLVNMERLARALGPLDQCIATDTTVALPPAAAGCVPLDIFGGPGSRTQEMLDYIRYTAIDTDIQKQRLFYANISTEIGEAAAILAGPLGIAFGAELRTESYTGVPDPLKQAELSSTNAEKATKGAYTAKEAYVEVSIPLLADISFDRIPGLSSIPWLQGVSLIESLDFSLATRHSQYTGFGSNTSGKIGMEYRPYSDLLIRATLSDAFRAPSIGDLYQGQATGYPEVIDICRGFDSDERADEFGIEFVAANCAADGVPSGVTSGAQVATTTGGNPELTPETARTLSAGFVFSPSFLPDFNITADYYKIELEQFISALGPDILQDICYRAPSDARAFCDLIVRETADDRQITRVFAVNQNFAGVIVEGVDVNLDYRLPLPETWNIGSFKFTFDGAYTRTLDNVVPSALGDRKISILGQEFAGSGATPRFKGNAGITWSRGEIEASWSTRYIRGVYEPCDDGLDDPGAANGGGNPTPVPTFEGFGLCSNPNDPVLGDINVLPDIFYHDVQASYYFAPLKTKFVLGVNNVLDQDPPVAVSAFSDSYDKATYEPWGSRTPYFNFQTTF